MEEQLLLTISTHHPRLHAKFTLKENLNVLNKDKEILKKRFKTI